MPFKITVLGSGTMMPTKKRHPAGYLVQAGETKILMDCGHTTIARLVDLGINISDISIISISHFHTDHFSDFLPIIHACWINEMFNNIPHQPPTVYAPKGFKERWKKLREIYWAEPTEKFPFKIIEGPTKNSLIETFPVNHVPWFNSQGIKITYQGKTLAYTGDIGSAEPMARIAKNVKDVDLLIIEAGVTKPVPNHYTVEQTLQLKQKANVKNVLLTHIRDKNLAHIKKACLAGRQAIAGDKTITIARDKQVITV